ncbi:MAG: CapA family protein [Oscillospiraceae bacterium]|jgi:poly-gamma-glutamate capsule biosynthesis protein CapA/YwtB (metallophosphatase superfamily)|nr:CapA family protein [Oscillospiraceae bacterium]
MTTTRRTALSAIAAFALALLLTSCKPEPELTPEFRDFLTTRVATAAISESGGGYRFTLDNGRLNVTDESGGEVWTTPPDWFVSAFQVGDIDCDGITDVAFTLWKSYRFGSEFPSRMTNDDATVRCHLYVYSVNGGRVKSMWCSSSLPRAIYSLELNSDGVRSPEDSGVLLVTREGEYSPDFREGASDEYTYAWSAFGFRPVESSDREISVAVVGDLMCHTAQIHSAWTHGGDHYDFNHAFTALTPLISAADFAVGNLETTLVQPGKLVSDYPRFAAPREFAEAIRDAGFDFVSTANNHALDFGIAGLEHTLRELDALGLAHSGTYAAQIDSESVAIVKVNGIALAFIVCTESLNGNEPDAPWRVDSLDSVSARIAQALELGADAIIVLPHMGVEYELETRRRYKDAAQAWLDAGADAVLASHPHIVQSMEFITIRDSHGAERRGFAAYSLGNFISSQRGEQRDVGCVVTLRFSKTDGERARLIAVELQRTRVRFQDDGIAVTLDGERYTLE